MVVGEKEKTMASPGNSQPPLPAPQIVPSPSAIDNIMSGISNTGAVKMNNHRKKLRQRFDIIKKLGQGTYGKVQLGINKETGQEVAIKTIKKCKIETEADLIRIRREVQIMSSVQHPNIIHIYEVFENREKMVLVMEFAAGGELYDYLSERKVLSEEEARRVFRQISTAVYYCHKHKICHRDLKLENILLDENGNAKIADFGLSNVFDDQRLLATFCGSPLYASPEIVKGTPYQGPEVDCWSLGVLLYTLVYGAMPYDGSNFKRLVKQISAGDYYEPKKPSNASPLIREMLTVCPKRRATIEQICNHWWVNEGYSNCCLDLAEELANQTPVRLDVLLSLAPVAVTSEQLVVPNPNEADANKQPVARSMSVGSIRDIAEIGNTEAERRIIDMVAAGGEAALAPSPTRTMTPAESPAQQPKRKPETTISSESVIGDASVGARKRDKPSDQLKSTQSKLSISEIMDVEEAEKEKAVDSAAHDKRSEEFSSSTLAEVNDADDMVEQPRTNVPKQTIASAIIEEVTSAPLAVASETAKTVAKKFGKTASSEAVPSPAAHSPHAQLERRDSLPDESAKPSSERRRSRILETAEKFQGGGGLADKPKKIVIPGVSVGSHKKEFERKASLTSSTLPPITPAEKRHLINSDSIEQADPPSKAGSRKGSLIGSGLNEGDDNKIPLGEHTIKEEASSHTVNRGGSGDGVAKLYQSDSKSSNLSLEEARRSMENSIALLNQAKTESNSDVDQLCAKTESVAVSTDVNASGDRQKKLKAREIIGNAIPRLGMGVRKPPVPFGSNGRSVSGGVVLSSPPIAGLSRNVSSPPDPRMYERESPLSIYSSKPANAVASPPAEFANDEDPPVKVSTAEITLKSATLPRRKIDAPKFGKETAKNEPSRYQGEVRTAPIRENQSSFSPMFSPSNSRATSLEPQQHRPKEHYIPIQRPGGGYISNAPSQRAMGPVPLSRQSTNDSDDTSDTQTASTATIGQQSIATSNSSQPIKKSPREFIIPIAVEGGGFVTPRAGSLEPSESNHSTGTSFSRFSGRPRKISSIFNDRDSEDESSPFHRMHRHTSIGRDSDSEDPASRFTYRLRSTRPFKNLQKPETNDSASSGEEDDEDGFEILTAENLFSTLLSRVRALTNRLNVKDDPSSDFPSSRFMNNLRQTHSPFWHHDPFPSRLNSSGAWRHSMTRDLGTNIDSMFSSRTGATLPRGAKSKLSNDLSNNANPSINHLQYDNSNMNGNCKNHNSPSSSSSAPSNSNRKTNTNDSDNHAPGETLDLADLDLSQLRLTKKDLEALSTLTPSLPKHFQDQLLAQLPPNQARKLSRTLSMQATGQPSASHVYKRSLSSGREMSRHNLNAAGKGGQATGPKETALDSPLAFDRKSLLRRSLSRGRDTITENCETGSARASDLPNRLSYTDRYRSNDFASTLPMSAIGSDYYSRLPPKTASDSQTSSDTTTSPIRRRSSSMRRVSRFLRPDFYDSSSNLAEIDDNSNYSKARRERERETQSVLREIRERSRDRARRDSIPYGDSVTDRPKSIAAATVDTTETTLKDARRKSSIPNIRITVDKQNGRVYHARNRSSERCLELCNDASECDKIDHPRCSAPIPQNTHEEASVSTAINSNANFADQIISELVQKSQETTASIGSEAKVTDGAPKKLKVKSKEGKKVKVLSKPVEDGSKKTVVENVNNLEMVTALTNEIESVTLPFPKSGISKLVRPKSYPSKEEKVPKKAIETTDKSPSTDVFIEKPADVSVEVTLRPKGLSNSKLTPPKEVVAKPSKKSSSPSSSASGGSVVSKNSITAAVEKLIEKGAERLSPVKSLTSSKAKADVSGDATTTPKLTKKKVKVVKKLKSEQSPPSDDPAATQPTEDAKVTKSPEKKVKSGFLYSIGQKFEKMRENSKNKEKKNAKNAATPVMVDPIPVSTGEMNEINRTEAPMKRADPSSAIPTTINATKTEQRKSRIDAMIRNLRERSVPHTIQNDASSLSTESGLIKRAVSVEDMTNGVPNFNKCNVNKVLGLFRRIEREQLQQQQLLRSPSSNIGGSRSATAASEKPHPNDERPKSGGFVPKLKKTGRPYYTGAKSDSIVTFTDQLEKRYQADKLNASKALITKIPQPKQGVAQATVNGPSRNENCPECGTNDCKDIKGINEDSAQTDSKRFSYNSNRSIETATRPSRDTQITSDLNTINDKERIRNNRKGLILDLNVERFDMPTTFSANNNNNNNNNGDEVKGVTTINNNNYYSNGNHTPHNNNHVESSSHTTSANNNGIYNFNNSSRDMKNADHSSNYMSDSRSLRDDCESTSTFLSPTDEPELYFDDWSICSSSVDDHSRLSPVPMREHVKYLPSTRTVHQYPHNLYPKSLTSSSHHVDATPSTSDTESVIDRIKRRSFYCRFNEKRPKRTSSIVGPLARDYYRDIASSKAKSKSSDAATFRTQSKSPTPMNRTDSGVLSPTLDDFRHYHARSIRNEDHRLDRPPRSGDYSNLRSTLTSPPAKYSSQSKGTPSGAPSASDYLLNGNHRPYSTRNSIYDGLTPCTSSSSNTSSTSPFIYGTYSPKRRISTSYLTPSTANVNSTAPISNGMSSDHHQHLANNCYATLGHRAKPKAYDQRSISMLDSSSLPSSMYAKGRMTAAANAHFAHLRPDYGDFSMRSSLRTPPPSTANV